jgi:hypothetical protein
LEEVSERIDLFVIAIISKRLLRWRCHRWRRVGRRDRIRAHQFLGGG